MTWKESADKFLGKKYCKIHILSYLQILITLYAPFQMTNSNIFFNDAIYNLIRSNTIL